MIWQPFYLLFVSLFAFFIEKRQKISFGLAVSCLWNFDGIRNDENFKIILGQHFAGIEFNEALHKNSLLFINDKAVRRKLSHLSCTSCESIKCYNTSYVAKIVFYSKLVMGEGAVHNVLYVIVLKIERTQNGKIETFSKVWKRKN